MNPSTLAHKTYPTNRRLPRDGFMTLGGKSMVGVNLSPFLNKEIKVSVAKRRQAWSSAMPVATGAKVERKIFKHRFSGTPEPSLNCTKSEIRSCSMDEILHPCGTGVRASARKYLDDLI